MKNRRISGVLATAAFTALATLGVTSTAHAAEDASEIEPSDQAGDFVPGEIAVDLKNNVTATDIADLARDYGLAIRPNSVFSEREKLEVANVSPAEEARIIERLARDPRVEHAEPMALYRTTFVPNDPLYAEKQWHLKRVDAERAWDYGCGEGVTVAVIDTGVACYDKGPFTRGTDLSGTRCGEGYNFINDTPEAYDDQGHGTHVAGTIAQTTNNGKGVAGVAYCATLMPVKVLNKNGWGTLADVAEGIRYAADHGAQVINMSLGGSSPAAILSDAVEHAIRKGVVVVAAAGNSGRAVGYPAAYDGVIAVSATDQNDKIAWFSSRGPQIAIGAPGVAVTQQTICEGGRNKCELFGTFNGTSMATPHVAGAAALIVGEGVTEPSAVRDALLKSAKPKEEPQLYGAGVLDAGAAVANVHWMHLAVRVAALAGLLGLLAWRIRKLGGQLVKGPGLIFGALLAGLGVAPFLPLLGVSGQLGDLRWVAEFVSRPFGEWDMFIGSGLHRWLPFASALPTMALTAFLFGAKRLRSTLGGFAVGSSALLAQMAISADVAFPLGSFALRVFAVVNALVCLFIARIALDRKNT